MNPNIYNATIELLENQTPQAVYVNRHHCTLQVSQTAATNSMDTGEAEKHGQLKAAPMGRWRCDSFSKSQGSQPALLPRAGGSQIS